MNQISILSDSPDTAGMIGRELAGMFEPHPVLRRDLARTKPAHADRQAVAVVARA